MGKKSAYKKIRKLAAQMPEIMVGRMALKGYVKGGDLIDRGITEVGGKAVIESESYREKEVVNQPLNHHRQMKDMYKKHGVKGVEAYAKEVNRYLLMQALKEQNPENQNTNEPDRGGK